MSTTSLSLKWGPVWLTYVACMRILARFLFSLHLILPQGGYNAEQMFQPRCCVGMLHSTCFNDIIVKGALISNVKKMHENSVFRNDQSGISKYHNVGLILEWISFHVFSWTMAADLLLWQQVAGVHQRCNKPTNQCSGWC